MNLHSLLIRLHALTRSRVAQVAFRYPFEAPTLPALALKIVACDHCALPDDTTPDLRELISTLLARSQNTRYTWPTVLVAHCKRGTLLVAVASPRLAMPRCGGAAAAAPPPHPL